VVLEANTKTVSTSTISLKDRIVDAQEPCRNVAPPIYKSRLEYLRTEIAYIADCQEYHLRIFDLDFSSKIQGLRTIHESLKNQLKFRHHGNTQLINSRWKKAPKTSAYRIVNPRKKGTWLVSLQLVDGYGNVFFIGDSRVLDLLVLLITRARILCRDIRGVY
jgi:hypothetical protein